MTSQTWTLPVPQGRLDLLSSSVLSLNPPAWRCGDANKMFLDSNFYHPLDMNEREITQMNLYSWSALGKQTAQVSYSNSIKLLRGLRPLCTVKTMTKYHKK